MCLASLSDDALSQALDGVVCPPRRQLDALLPVGPLRAGWPRTIAQTLEGGRPRKVVVVALCVLRGIARLVSTRYVDPDAASCLCYFQL